MKKVVIISGGSGGLGKEIAKRLSSQHTIIILSPHKEKLESVAKQLNCDFEICDISNYKDVVKAVQNIIDKYQRIDCLINNAGVWVEGELDSNDAQQIKEAMDINTLGVMYLTKIVIPHMKKQSAGLIINVISQAGFYGKAERSVYTASKFALTGFTKSIQPELAEYSISVTGIYPGKMNTQMFEKVGIKKSMDDALDPKEVAKVIEFLLTFNKSVVFPEIGIKSIKN